MSDPRFPRYTCEKCSRLAQRVTPIFLPLANTPAPNYGDEVREHHVCDICLWNYAGIRLA